MPHIWATAGVHPHDAAGFHSDILPQLARLADDLRVVAIGEIGLDFYRNLSPQKAQKETFRLLIHLAREVALPIIIHDREAHKEVLTILKRRKGRRNRRGIPLLFRRLGNGPNNAWT